MTWFESISTYFQLGFTHVIPLGFDHILFILTLFFFSSNLKKIVVQCSIFTLAHSISLALAASGLVIPNANIVEPLIALSILFTAIENIVNDKINPGRLVLIFGFGLIHGLGFARALNEMGVSKNQFFPSLLSFNFGIETAQIVVILVSYFLLGKWFSKKVWYKERVVYPISSVIACVALFWVIERILFPI